MLAYFIENNDVYNVIVGGVPYSIHNTHPNFKLILDNMGNDLSLREWKNLLDIPAAINTYMGSSGVEIKGNSIYYKGYEIHNVVAQKILEAMTQNRPYQRLVLFLENLVQNPSSKAVNRLYYFLSNHGMAITEDGCFVGYKGVQTDFSSKFKDNKTGKPLYYNIGSVVSMPRNEVDDNENNGCSRGIHVGSYDYAKGWGPVVLLVKVNPKDAVTVPVNEINKLRVCELTVLQECERLVDEPYWDNRDVYEDEEPDYEDYEDSELDEDVAYL